MFFTKSQIKKRLMQLAIAAVTMATLVVATPAAHASGETYTWKDDTNQAITVSGGTGNVSGTLTKSSSAGDPSFSGPVTFTCGTTTKTASVSLSVGADDYKKVYPTLGQVTAPADASCVNFDVTTGVSKADGSTTAQTDAQAEQDATNCDQGSVSWIMCPFIDNATSAITNLANGVLVPLLKVNQVTPQTTPDLYHIWENMRNLAEILFILVFFVLIFATVSRQDFGMFDQYTIKRIMPRLVAAAILVQASFLLSGLLVDVGNVLGGGIEALLRVATDPHSDASVTHVLTNLVGVGLTGTLALGAILGAASWIAIAPILASLAITLLVVFLVLGLRFLLIAILIVVSPLALVAWVLPNTAHWTRDWFKVFFRLILMYPIIVGVISLAGLVNQILPSGSSVTDSTAASLAANLIKPVVVIAAFLIIPATFKLAGRGLSRAYNILDGHAQRGRSKLKGSDFWQRGANERQARKNNYMGRVLDSKAITTLGANRLTRPVGGALAAGAGMALLGASSNTMALNRSNSKLKKKIKKDVEELDEATVPNLYKALQAYGDPDLAERAKARTGLMKDAPNLLRMASTEAGQAAVVSRLADLGLLTEKSIQQFSGTPRGRNLLSVSADPARTYRNLFSEAGKEIGAKPVILNRMRDAQPDYAIKDAGGEPVYMRDVAGKIMRDTSGKMIELKVDRPVGSLGINEAGRAIRRISGATFGDKHAPDNFEVMNLRSKATATPAEIRDAKDAALAYALHLDNRAILQSFNPNHRDFNTTPLETRLKWARAVQANRDVFTSYNPSIVEATTTHLEMDESLSSNLARQAGVPSDKLESMSNHAKAMVAYEWMKGRSYDATRDAGRDFNTEGQSWMLDRQKARRDELFQSRGVNPGRPARGTQQTSPTGTTPPPTGPNPPGGTPNPGGPTT